MSVLRGIGPVNDTRATTRDWMSVLAEVPVFAGLGRRQLRKLVEQAQFGWFARGDEVVASGAAADSLFVILAGEAKARGKRAARTLRRGDVFGETSVIGGRRSATVVAATELNVMVVPQSVARRLVATHAPLALKIIEDLGYRVRGLEDLAA